MRSTLLVSILVFAAAGCSDDESPSGKSAAATLTPTVPGASGAAGSSAAPSTATGTITFTSEGTQVKAVVNITKAPPGEHGFHIHANPDCAMGGDAAGPHWDPAASGMHGAWGGPAHHGGDIGNITIDANGNGSKSLTTGAWSIGTGAANDVVGHAVILHAAPDDLTTQPTGAAGARIACGVIELR